MENLATSSIEKEEQLKNLFKELRETTLFRCYLELKDDSKFLGMTLQEQLLELLKLLKSKREVNRYCMLRRKSLLPDEVDVKPLDKALNNNKLKKDQIDFIITHALKNTHKIVFVTGPTGAGKTTIVQNTLDLALRSQLPVAYFDYASWMFEYSSYYFKEHNLYESKIEALMKNRIIAFDDALLCEAIPREGEVMKDLISRAELKHVVLIFSSQISVSDWYKRFSNNPCIADAIMDRITQNIMQLELKGQSLRRPKTTSSSQTNSQEIENK